jgi:hypothetical protein
MNSAVDALTADKLSSKAAVQAMVDAYVKILAEANGSTADVTPGIGPSALEYQMVGATIGLASSNNQALSLLNDTLGSLSSTAIDSIFEIDLLASITGKIIKSAIGAPGDNQLSISDLVRIGVSTTGAGAINEVNIKSINSVISSVGQAQKVDTLGEVLALIKAQATILNYAGDSSASVPDLSQYKLLGIINISAEFLSSINDSLLNLTVDKIDDIVKLQKVVNAYKLILAEANGSSSDLTPGSNPSIHDYELIGAKLGASANDEEHFSLLNSCISNLEIDSVNTVSKINSLAAAVNSIMSNAAGGAGVEFSDLKLLGVTDVTPESILAIRSSINASDDNGRSLDSLEELQNLVTQAVSIAKTSQDNIVNFSENSSISSLALSDYKNVGVVGIDSVNLSAINSAIKNLQKFNVDTAYEVQTIVNSYARILSEANGLIADVDLNINPDFTDFLNIGAPLGLAKNYSSDVRNLSSSAFNLYVDVIANLLFDSVNSISKLGEVSMVVDKIISLSALDNNATVDSESLSISDLAKININLDDNSNNFYKILHAIRDSNNLGFEVDSYFKINTIINAAVM